MPSIELDLSGKSNDELVKLASNIGTAPSWILAAPDGKVWICSTIQEMVAVVASLNDTYKLQ